MRNLFIATMLVFSVVGCHEDDCDEAVVAEEAAAEEESEEAEEDADAEEEAVEEEADEEDQVVPGLVESLLGFCTRVSFVFFHPEKGVAQVAHVAAE